MTDTMKISGYRRATSTTTQGRARLTERLRETIGATLGVEVRALSDVPLGPHPVPQFRFAFHHGAVRHDRAVADVQSAGLDVLVHPLTDSWYDDHSRYAIWLGEPVAVKLDTLSRGYRAGRYSGPLRRFVVAGLPGIAGAA